MEYPVQLHQIEAVVAIAEAASFRKVAEVLGRTQPALTKSIAALEETWAFCLLSKQLLDTIAPSHAIVTVPIQETLPKFPFSLVTQKSRPLTPAAAQLVQDIRRRAMTLNKAGFGSDSQLE